MYLEMDKTAFRYWMLFLLIILLTGIAFAGKNKKPETAESKVTISDQRKQPPQELITPTISSSPSLGEEINWQVIGTGGGSGSSEDYELNGTSGQAATGSGTSEDYQSGSGYWSGPSESKCDNAGDSNHDGQANVGDAVYTIAYVFNGGPPPPMANEGDANNDCSVNVGDAVYLISYVFKNGSPPECGCAE